jgi:hypothetical protein
VGARDDERAFAARAAQELAAAQLLVPRGGGGSGSAPTFADSLAVWYRVSPGETALAVSPQAAGV